MTDRPPAELRELLAWLRTGRPVGRRTDFPTGTAMPDGRLDLCKQALGPSGVTMIADMLPPGGPVRHLLLGTDELGDEGAETAARGATGSGSETLYLGCNGITTAGACRIADRLIASPGVVRGLWLKRNPLGADGGRIVGELVGTGLSTIDLVQTGLDAAALAELVDHILAAGGVGRLFVSGNRLGPRGGEELARLVSGGGVEELYASAAALGDEGATAIARALEGVAVRRLSLASNGVAPAAATSLVAAATRGVESLDLGRVRSAAVLGARDNQLGDEGARAVAAVLSRGPHGLRHLDLSHTGIGSRGALHLLGAATRAATATRLTLGAGIASRVRRDLDRLAAAVPELKTHPEVAAVKSVYRTRAT